MSRAAATPTHRSMGWKLGTNEEKAVANPSMRCSAFPEKSMPGASLHACPSLVAKRAIKTYGILGSSVEQFLVHKDGLRRWCVVGQRVAKGKLVFLAADRRIDGNLLTGSVERTAGANTVAFPKLGLGAAALAVLLGVVADVPDGLVVCPVNFLADLNRGPVDRDKETIV